MAGNYLRSKRREASPRAPSPPGSVFVFGSNLAGRHGRGAAHEAMTKHGAVYGQGVGRQGNSYAIPTKDNELRPLGLMYIRMYVYDFLEYAMEHPEETFYVTAIGCGLAGYAPEEIAPSFWGAPANCILAPEFVDVLDRLAAEAPRTSRGQPYLRTETKE